MDSRLKGLLDLPDSVSAMLGFGGEVKHRYRYQYDEDDDVNFDYEVQQSDGDEKEAAKGCWSDRGGRTEQEKVSAMLGFGSEVKHCYRYQYDEDDDVNFDYEVQQSDGDEKEAAKGCWSDRGRRTEQEKRLLGSRSIAEAKNVGDSSGVSNGCQGEKEKARGFQDYRRTGVQEGAAPKPWRSAAVLKKVPIERNIGDSNGGVSNHGAEGEEEKISDGFWGRRVTDTQEKASPREQGSRYGAAQSSSVQQLLVQKIRPLKAQQVQGTHKAWQGVSNGTPAKTTLVDRELAILKRKLSLRGFVEDEGKQENGRAPSHSSIVISRHEPAVAARRGGGGPCLTSPTQEMSPADAGASISSESSTGLDSDDGPTASVDENAIPYKLSTVMEELKQKLRDVVGSRDAVQQKLNDATSREAAVKSDLDKLMEVHQDATKFFNVTLRKERAERSADRAAAAERQRTSQDTLQRQEATLTREVANAAALKRQVVGLRAELDRTEGIAASANARASSLEERLESSAEELEMAEKARKEQRKNFEAEQTRVILKRERVAKENAALREALGEQIRVCEYLRSSVARAEQFGRDEQKAMESAWRAERVKTSSFLATLERIQSEKDLEHAEKRVGLVHRIRRLEGQLVDLQNQATTRKAENVRPDRATIGGGVNREARAEGGAVGSKRARRGRSLRPLSPNSQPLRQLSPFGNSASGEDQPTLNRPGANSPVAGRAVASGQGGRAFRRTTQEMTGHDTTGSGLAGETRDGSGATRTTRRAVGVQRSSARAIRSQDHRSSTPAAAIPIVAPSRDRDRVRNIPPTVTRQAEVVPEEAAVGASSHGMRRRRASGAAEEMRNEEITSSAVWWRQGERRLPRRGDRARAAPPPRRSRPTTEAPRPTWR